MNNRIDQVLQGDKENILSIYFTAGFPRLEDTMPILRGLQAAGVDMVEIGMPYSDPMADGPTIQSSGSQAIKNGMSVRKLFEQLRQVREEISMPLILMGYLNQIMQFGMDDFLEECTKIGIDGLIIPDLPADIFESEYMSLFAEKGVHLSFLITPQTSENRIRQIDAVSSGFIYMVSDASITGAKSDISASQRSYFARIRDMHLSKPLVIGFGISSHGTFAEACRYSRGAIVGSAFINALKDTEQTEIAAKIATFVEKIRIG